jgi:cysteinyl-tRNA synthetase
MDDDFNTREALAVLSELATDANSGSREAGTLLRALGGALGLLERDARVWFQGRPATVALTGQPMTISGGSPKVSPATATFTNEQINKAIEDRNAARKARNFAEADRVRQELLDAGIVLEDTPHGTTWRRA